MKEQIIEWDFFESEQWSLYVAKPEEGLCYVGSPGQRYEDLKSWIQKRFPKAKLNENKQVLKPYLNEMREYLGGTRQVFSLPIDIKGTPFQEEIWNTLKQIPYGKTIAYSEIAALIQKPTAVRAVGKAIGANPVLFTVPCHRVIGKNGSITGYRGGIALKQFLLELEAQNRGSDD